MTLGAFLLGTLISSPSSTTFCVGRWTANASVGSEASWSTLAASATGLTQFVVWLGNASPGSSALVTRAAKKAHGVQRLQSVGFFALMPASFAVNSII
jgi:hypothetical protein